MRRAWEGGPSSRPPRAVGGTGGCRHENCARSSQWFLSESCWRAEGLRLQWERCCMNSGHGSPPSAPSFSLRAFYLERSNLPTDASTTAVKIDQVCPPFHHPCVGSQVKTEHRAQGGTPASWQSSPRPLQCLLQEVSWDNSLPILGAPASSPLLWNSSDDLFSLALTCLCLPHSLVYLSISLRLEPDVAVQCFFCLLVSNSLPTFKNQKISHEMEVSSFS